MPYPTNPNRQISIPFLLKIGNGKIKKIGKYLFDKNMNEIAIFFGTGIEELMGKDLYESLKAYEINIKHKETIDNVALEEIVKTAFSLPKIDAILGIGGGKALDFAKYAAYLLKIPYISLPTSISNDGFCSPSSSLTVEGKRKSVKSAIPFGVIIDLDIIAKSPKIAFYSGLGDMVSKITALNDWKEAANQKLSGYNDFASLMAYNSLDLLFLRHSTDIHSPDFIRSLTTSLLISGIAMEIAGTSRPASGSEHLISHALDEVCPHPQSHGIQVGVATLLCALLQNSPHIEGLRDILTHTGFIDFVKKNPLSKEYFIKALEIAPKIKNNYYTVLSKEDSLTRAIDFISADPTLREIIV